MTNKRLNLDPHGSCLSIKTPPPLSVLFAIGRDACTDKIGLDKVEVKTNPKNGKIFVNEKDGSNIPYVHAIGDIADGKLELTPVAIQVRLEIWRLLFA